MANPAILKWARENAHLTLEEAAKKLQISDLTIYETGEKTPHPSLLFRMSKQYHIPLLTFYLDQQPRPDDHGEDFRTLPETPNAQELALVNALVSTIKARQIILREALIDADEADELPFVGSHTMDSDVLSVVQTMRETLAMDIEEYRNQKNSRESFRFLRQHAEHAGIFVILLMQKIRPTL